jgi:hypothetical protein
VTILKGPADADHYRVKVGRYGDRWYTDPLEASARWEKSDAAYPSISTVKKAAGQDWSFVSIKRIADADPDRLRQLADLPADERYDAMNSINKRGLGRAAERGTNVHLYCESRLYGTTPPLMAEGMPGYNYLKAVDDFFDTYNPKLVAAEYPVFHRTLNGVGYGGTPDAVVEIGGELYGIDWKTRTETSDHGAYAEEGAQIAAGAFADYMIVENADGHAVRQPLPQLAGGLIISIKPDGCRVYPIDLAAAWNHWEAMHAWWCARQNERVSIGKPWAPGKRQSDAKPAKVEPLATVTPPPTPPDEGLELDKDDPAVVAVRGPYMALREAGGDAWINALRADAIHAGVDFHLSGKLTLRRARIMAGLVALTVAEVADDDVLKALVRHVTGHDAMTWPSAGACVGSLGATDAALFVAACDAFVAGRFELVYDGGPALKEVA